MTQKLMALIGDSEGDHGTGYLRLTQLFLDTESNLYIK